MHSDRWQRLESLGARPQRLLFASTSTKDPRAPDTMYITALAAPNTVNTMPDETLLAFGDHGVVGSILAPDGGDCEKVLAEYASAGIDPHALGAPAADRGRQVLRQVVAGSLEVHRSQVQGAEVGDRIMGLTPLIGTATWQALAEHQAKIKDVHLRQLFADDPGRAERFTVEGAGLLLDYSKNRITDETMQLLLHLAEERKVAARRDAMFRGEKINTTEKRAVLHVALRAPRGAVIEVDGHNVVPDVHAVLDRMADFADKVRSGAWTGHTGKRIKNVINVGIGGSYLGPEMAYLALRPFSDREHDLPLRLQRGRRRLHRGNARSRCRPRRCSSSRPRPSPRSRR